MVYILIHYRTFANQCYPTGPRPWSNLGLRFGIHLPFTKSRRLLAASLYGLSVHQKPNPVHHNLFLNTHCEPWFSFYQSRWKITMKDLKNQILLTLVSYVHSLFQGVFSGIHGSQLGSPRRHKQWCFLVAGTSDLLWLYPFYLFLYM